MDWSDSDRQRFADRNILKASSVPGKRPVGPSVDDWGFGWGVDADEPIAASCDLENPVGPLEDDWDFDWGADADEPIVASCDLENPESCETCQ